MTIGIVKFFNTAKGYGFIKPDDGGRDVFVHVSDLKRSNMRDIVEGDQLEFDVEQDKKGAKAVNLRLA